MKKDLRAAVFACFLFLQFYGSIYAQNFSESNLPILVLNTGNQNIDGAWTDMIVHMGIIDNGPGNRNHLADPYNSYSGKIKIHLRGQSALSLPKKSFKITTITDTHADTSVAILGMPKDEDWVLDGIYQDKTFLRDALSFKIFTEMGHYSSRTRFVEVVVNGDYRGIYAVDEKIKRDEDRVNISKLKKEDISGEVLTGGYIIKLDKTKWDDEGWYSEHSSDNTGDSANFWVYHYPKPDSMPQVQKDYIRNYIAKFEDVMDSPYYTNLDSGYRKYIDVESFVDMFILTELSRNVDGYRVSSYFYKDRDSKGGKLHAGPAWDFDIAWGNCGTSGGNNPYWWQYGMAYHTNFIPFWWDDLMKDGYFKNDLKCRWQMLRNTVLDADHLYDYIDSMEVYLDEAQERNFQRWPIMGQVVPPAAAPAKESYEDEIDALKYWIAQRLSWLDSHIPGQCNVSVEETQTDMLQAFPNPFNDEITIVYDHANNGKVKMDLYNAVGAMIEPLYEGSQQSGMYQQTIGTANLPAGIYFIRLSVNEKISNYKLVKVGR